MKRRLLATFLSLCLLVGLLPTVALAAEEGTKENPWDISAEGEGNNVYAYLMSNETMEATYGDVISLSTSPNSTYTLHIEGTGAMEDFDNPTSTEDGAVKAPWYAKLSPDDDDLFPITEIVIGDGITYVGSYAFAYTSVTMAAFNENIADYGSGIYYGCTDLTTVDWTNFKPTKVNDDFVNYRTETGPFVPFSLFDQCENLKTCKIGDTTYSEGTLVLPDNITGICTAAFRGTGFSTVDFSDGLKEIEFVGPYGLASLSSLKSVTIPNDVEFYSADENKGGARTFTGGALETVTIQSPGTTIAVEMFYNCGSLTTINEEDNITEIGQSAFSGSGLTSFSSESVKKIGQYAFLNNTSLASLTLGAVEEIGGGAFGGCSALKTVDIEGSTTLSIPNTAFGPSGSSPDNAAPIESFTLENGTPPLAFTATAKSTLKTLVLGDGVKWAIPGDYCAYAEQLQSVTLGKGITSIGNYAFYKCSNLSTVTLPADGQLTTIGTAAFSSDYNYAEDNLTSNSPKIQTIDIPASVTTIGDRAFMACMSLETVRIAPNSKLTNIGASAFINCFGLETVDLSGISDNAVTFNSFAFNTTSGTRNQNCIFYVTDDSVLAKLNSNNVVSINAGSNNLIAVTNGGTFAENTKFEQGVLAEPTKDGYIFAGWYENSDFSGTAATSVEVGHTYYAKWTEDDAEGGTPSTTGDKNDNGTTQGTIETELSDGMESSGQTDAETDEVIDEIDNTPVNSLPAGDTTDNEPAEEKSVKEVPAPVEPTLITPSAMGCASASTMSLTYMAPGDGSDGDDDTVYSFYVGEELLGRTGTGETVLTYDTAQKDLQIGKNTVEVYTGESKTGEPTATITVNLKQKPVTVTGLTAEDRYYNGSTDITLTGGKLTGIEGTDNVSFAATGTVADASAGTNKPVTATVVLSGTDAGWYTATASGVTVDIYETSGGGGGGSSSPSYAITVDSGKHGDVTVNRSRATKGSTVTITVDPDAGYELDTLVVTDKNGNEIKLTDKGNGKYTFKMPGSQVTVEAAFAKINEQPSTGFVDVPANAYYADAVKWAVENGVTEGTSATTFSPDMSCTRAQMVTFLWRAAGSPAPKSTVNPFTDIQPDTYYYDAVLWAAEQGITSGTSATTFAPDATVTRGQTVTFLWRYDGSPVVSSGSFADVPADAYYASAVAWAVSEGVTNGTSATTFSPDANCTRAQIVTFLWRELA